MFKNNNLYTDLVCKFLIIAIVATFFVLSGCEKKQEPAFELEKTSFSNLPGWNKDNIENIVPAFTASCKSTITDSIAHSHLTYYNRQALKKICQIFLNSEPFTPQNFRKFIHTWFEPYKIKSPEKSLFTGYYAPIVKGSFVKSDKYKFPVYTKPTDLVSIPDLSVFIPEEPFIKRRISGKVVKGWLVPHFTRAEIDNGALAGQKLEIIWLDNAIDLFFLQIQGSGFVELPDGSRLTLTYNGTNGHRYTPIGRYLIEIGELSEQGVSMQAIKEWLHNNPDKVTNVLHKNKSYVFSKISNNNAVYGCQKTKLHPGRSIAIDLKYIPLGIPMWIDTQNPSKQNEPMRFLAMTQDTGGAIKGPIRADIFCGYGSKAGALAGRLKESGFYYLLLPKEP